MTAMRALVTAFVCLGLVAAMVLFPPTVTQHEEYWDKNERLLDKPVVRVVHGYEFIASIPPDSNRIPGYEVRIDWLRLAFQVALVAGCGFIWHRIGGIKNPAEQE